MVLRAAVYGADRAAPSAPYTRPTTAVASVDEGMLRSVWTESDYRIDICRVIKGSHIERL